MNIYKRYSLAPSLLLSVGWITILLIIISLNSVKPCLFLQFGPSNKTELINLKIDSWEKWFLTMMYSFFSQFIYSFINSTLNPFMINVIRDHKTEWRDTMFKAQVITFISKTYGWFNEISKLFLIMTFQLQYYVPALFADILIGGLTTKNLLMINAMTYNFNTIIIMNTVKMITTIEIANITVFNTLNSLYIFYNKPFLIILDILDPL